MLTLLDILSHWSYNECTRLAVADRKERKSYYGRDNCKINGMACGMCETHINDAVRNNFKVKKVTSSHSKAQTVIVVEEDIPDDKLKDVVEKAGYEFAGADRKPYVKKGLFGFGK